MGKWTRRAFISSGIIAGGTLAVGVAIRPGDRSGKVADLIAADGAAVFDVWLKLAPDNTVTAIIPHAEMGQGVHTSLAMMLADELDANWDEVRMQEAPAHKEYANYAMAKGYALGDADFPAFLVDTVDGVFLTATRMMGLQITGGSTSVKTTGQQAMRVAGAATRSMLLQAAAEEWQVAVSELSASSGRIEHPASHRSAPFAAFAERAASLPEPAKPRLKTSSEFTIMGTSPARLDVPAKVDGSASFGIDVRLPGMKFAAVKAAPVFGARIANVRNESVQNMPGVRRIVNLGDAVAVVADSYWQAEQALARLTVSYTESGNERINQSDIFNQFTADLDKAVAEQAFETDVKAGDAAAAFTAGERIIEAEYRVPYLAHATMEPMNCTAWMRDGRCELWTGTQNPLGFALEVAKALDIDADDVTLHNQYLGGGFGRRAFPDYAIQAARIARESAYPVQLIWSRAEDTRHDHYRQANISRFRAAINADGMPLAWENSYVDKHDPAEATHIPYGIDHQLIRYTSSQSHVPWGFWRSVDHSLHAFFTESFIDELAIAAGADPYTYRRQLLANNPRFRDVLDLAAEKSDWQRPLPENFGRGIAIHRSFGTIVAQVLEVEIVAGKLIARRAVCAVDAGYAVHPDGMKAQMESGIIYGLTAALYGEISIRDGAVQQSNFHDYPMLRMSEAPEIETHIINSGESMGGAGEPGTPAIAPALTNAIFDATGTRIRELPVQRHDLSKPDLKARDVV
ncbi:xanthine dehydrogenase family protein molybdopterin-binding subunit [Woeseia oceani]|uniref:Isoquinoline 1-oxidoreductase n=1 Tax=Woeseia oceani TaxID=1548547 RepID=A0A193LCP7_9GAMM|nr:molybdopterin cofactor-binding domain-containing protein [Woeseia oceani]ANO50310.1 isoquinoline 1-oxidoreductase [Woeseia oceani]